IIMQLHDGLDTGVMLMAQHYIVAQGTGAGAVHEKLAHKAPPQVLNTLEAAVAGTRHVISQMDDDVIYARKIAKDEGEVGGAQAERGIYYQILGLSPAPGAYFTHAGENIKILEASWEPGDAQIPAGTLVDEHLGIACQPGILRPTLLQRPGKNKVSAEDFL